MSIQTFDTKYGYVSILENDVYIAREFKNGKYWDENTLLLLRDHIDPNKNIIEVGAHVGTSSIVYSSFLNPDSKLYAFEPQRKLFQLLVRNIYQNNLQNQIVPYNSAVFCVAGKAHLNAVDLDGGGGIVARRYTDESHLNCNFGGIGLGDGGEDCCVLTIDSLNLPNIGFIHVDAQGAENWILYGGIGTIRKFKPVILFEDNQNHARILYNTVFYNYPQYATEGLFNVVDFCVNQLGYRAVFPRFNGSIDTLLIP